MKIKEYGCQCGNLWTTRAENEELAREQVASTIKSCTQMPAENPEAFVLISGGPKVRKKGEAAEVEPKRKILRWNVGRGQSADIGETAEAA